MKTFQILRFFATSTWHNNLSNKRKTTITVAAGCKTTLIDPKCDKIKAVMKITVNLLENTTKAILPDCRCVSQTSQHLAEQTGRRNHQMLVMISTTATFRRWIRSRDGPLLRDSRSRSTAAPKLATEYTYMLYIDLACGITLLALHIHPRYIPTPASVYSHSYVGNL